MVGIADTLQLSGFSIFQNLRFGQVKHTNGIVEFFRAVQIQV
jgi:hypothetical protein